MEVKRTHGGRRRNQTGRPKVAPCKKMRRRPIGMLESDWAIVKRIAASADVSEDEIIRRLVRGEIWPELSKRVKSAGWRSVREFLDALTAGHVKMPERPEVMPSGEMLQKSPRHLGMARQRPRGND